MQFRTLIVLASALAACGDSDKDFTPEVARSVYDLANARLVALHQTSIDAGTFPAEMEGACSGGGTVAMVPGNTPEGAHFPDLAHPFVDCKLGTFTFDGNLDYTHIVDCEAGGASYSISGELEVAGYGACAMEAMKVCDELVAATACGFTLAGS